MNKQSAGILLYRHVDDELQVFLVHPGGPFWKNKDNGAWTIPKGEFTDTEHRLEAAIREFKEETGMNIEGKFTALAPVKQKGGKIVYAWAIAGNIDAGKITSNNFEMEWPPRSGKLKSFPEIDKAAWYSITDAREKIISAQVPLLDELNGLLKGL